MQGFGLAIHILWVENYECWGIAKMGSTGSGRFSDYPGGGGGNSGAGGTGGSGGSGGGGGNEDRCVRAFSVSLQDIEHSERYIRTSTLPPVGEQLYIEHRKRVVAVDASGESVGSLPTTYNYLADCIADGYSYSGIVSASSGGANAALVVDFAPNE